MTRMRILSISGLALWMIVGAAGQSPATPAPETSQNGEPVSLHSLPHTFIHDEIHFWKSPFDRHNFDSHTVKKYVIPFVVISAAFLATDRKISDAQPNTLDQTKWSGRVSDLGAWYSLMGFTGGSYLLGKLSGDSHLREAGLLGLEAFGHAQVVTFAIKEVANRERPTDNDGHGSFFEGGSSFPSGHSASAFAVATVYAYEYRDNIAVPITAYSLAGLISASRLSARRHWMSDIFVGGSLGFLIGRFTYKRNHHSDLPGSPVDPAPQPARLIPDVDIGGTNVLLAWHL